MKIKYIQNSIRKIKKGYYELGKFPLKDHWKIKDDEEVEYIIDDWIDWFYWKEGTPNLIIVSEDSLKQIRGLIQ